MNDFITSTSNPLLKRLRALSDKKHRLREGAFVVEGHQPVWRAVESGWTIDTMVIAPELITNEFAFEMIDGLERGGTRVARLSASTFRRISERDGPAGVMAIVRSRTTSIQTARANSGDTWIVLHRVHNPGNLGTIIRTADAAGCAGLVICGDSADPFDSVAVKASMGSLFSLPIVIERDFEVVNTWARSQGMKLIGTSGYASDAHWNMTWPEPHALVLGNEGDGLPEEILQKVDTTVRIPMAGSAESLNLGIAAALLMYEARRHRI